MSAVNKINLNEYRDLIDKIAHVEFIKFSSFGLIELPELINIGNNTLYLLFKKHSAEHYNSTYLATAIKWAIRNEVRRRYKWYTLKNSRKTLAEEDGENTLREEVYKTILSIEDMQEAEVPTQIKAQDFTPEENVELVELKKEILEAMKKLSPREKNIIVRRFYKGRTQMEIAAEIGISQAQVSRLEKSALKQMKTQI